MSVANIFNVPSDENELKTWGTLHMLWHREANRKVFQVFNIVLPEYILDPADFGTQSDFLQSHQTMHNNLDSLLAIASYNLTDVDMEDPSQRVGWFQAHAELTRTESNTLGVFA